MAKPARLCPRFFSSAVTSAGCQSRSTGGSGILAGSTFPLSANTMPAHSDIRQSMLGGRIIRSRNRFAFASASSFGAYSAGSYRQRFGCLAVTIVAAGWAFAARFAASVLRAVGLDHGHGEPTKYRPKQVPGTAPLRKNHSVAQSCGITPRRKARLPSEMIGYTRDTRKVSCASTEPLHGRRMPGSAQMAINALRYCSVRCFRLDRLSGKNLGQHPCV